MAGGSHFRSPAYRIVKNAIGALADPLPEDVAAVVRFLCTEPNMYIHGQVIAVNGGLATG